MRRAQSQKSYVHKPDRSQRSWHVINADGLVLGRLAAYVAMILRGKTKPTYTPGVDCGDNVIIINAEKVRLTGNKLDQKRYHRHTGYPGGIKTQTARQIQTSRFPERLIAKAVARMIPRGPLGRETLRHLKVYAGPEHPHHGQTVQALDFKAMNSKNHE